MSICGKSFAALGSGRKSVGDTSALYDMRGQIAAINKAQAEVEFGLDGTVLTAIDNFLHALGYLLDEIKGRHHSLFVTPPYSEIESSSSQSPEPLAPIQAHPMACHSPPSNSIPR